MVDSKQIIADAATQDTQQGYKFNEAGRRFHGDSEVAYILPNDDDETSRLHRQHLVLRYVLQRNFQAPVTKLLEKGITVLDSGCGPGSWTLELANAYPNSKFYGVDISNVVPNTTKPENVEFSTANIAKALPYPDNTFDYVHQRLLFGGLTSQDWENALKEIYRVLKPGGYVELAEFSLFDLVNIGPKFTKLQQANIGVFNALGMPVRICDELEGRLEAAGFVNRVLNVTPLPVNHDGKRGESLWENARHGYMNIRPALVRVYSDWDDLETYKAFMEECGQEARENKSCCNWYDCCAQKPL